MLAGGTEWLQLLFDFWSKLDVASLCWMSRLVIGGIDRAPSTDSHPSSLPRLRGTALARPALGLKTLPGSRHARWRLRSITACLIAGDLWRWTGPAVGVIRADWGQGPSCCRCERDIGDRGTHTYSPRTGAKLPIGPSAAQTAFSSAADGVIDSATADGFSTFIAGLLQSKGRRASEIGLAFEDCLRRGRGRAKTRVRLPRARLGVLPRPCSLRRSHSVGDWLFSRCSIGATLGVLRSRRCAQRNVPVLSGTVPDLVPAPTDGRALLGFFFYTGHHRRRAFTPVLCGLFSDAIGLTRAAACRRHCSD